MSAASVPVAVSGGGWPGRITTDDVLVGAVGVAFMLIVLWVIIRDASKSPPRDNPR